MEAHSMSVLLYSSRVELMRNMVELVMCALLMLVNTQRVRDTVALVVSIQVTGERRSPKGPRLGAAPSEWMYQVDLPRSNELLLKWMMEFLLSMMLVLMPRVLDWTHQVK